MMEKNRNTTTVQSQSLRPKAWILIWFSALLLFLFGCLYLWLFREGSFACVDFYFFSSLYVYIIMYTTYTVYPTTISSSYIGYLGCCSISLSVSTLSLSQLSLSLSQLSLSRALSVAAAYLYSLSLSLFSIGFG